MAPELSAAIEQISGRKVLAFLSDNHIEPDCAVESFVLVPRVDGNSFDAGGDDGGYGDGDGQAG
jgi:uncharacterized protein YbcI